MVFALTDDAGPFFVEDIPEEPFVSAVTDGNGDPVAIAPGDVKAGLRRPDGSYALPLIARDVDADEDTFTLPWGTETPFTTPGVHWIDALVHNQRAEPVPVVVETLDGWTTLAMARTSWRDLPTDPRVAYELLQVAKRDVIAYAPALAAGAPIPDSYRTAQVMHARDIWNSGVTDPSGDIGSETFATTPYPMDWMVRQVLRPKRAIPKVARFPEEDA